ncbi:hypothetical protein DBR47_04295 [Paucibacter sp. KBW04]|uniref:hypothetical protein n=1 Tax=Paucibacter sp. KBW04 TaxID=2153361 RepID=UPI000F565611|nr:hypothetical protein [Paucibacter sp. KBW04]RQO62460.1 hypothetical protein DBR47_04295 [Paucibacter sp. KBW04]
MMIFRLVVGLLLFAGVLSFALYIATGQVVWRQRGLVIVKWTVLAGLGFFAVLILERLAMFL